MAENMRRLEARIVHNRQKLAEDQDAGHRPDS